MSEATTSVSDAITPANILQPVTVPVPVPAPESKPPTAQPEAAPAETPADKEGPAEDAAKDDTQKDDPKRKASTRINELYAQKKAAERQTEIALREVAELRKQLGQIQQQTDPNDWQAQQRADIRSAVKEERLTQLEQEARSAIERARETRVQGYQAKLEAAQERIPDINDAYEQFSKLPLTEHAADIISESEKAAEITYYLAKNPAEAYEIASLPPHLQGAKLARIEAKVSQGSPRRTSAAPPPVPIVSANSAPATPALKDMGVADIGKLIYGR